MGSAGVGSLISGGGRQAARAAGRAAQAQEAQSRENLEFAKQSQQQAVSAARGSSSDLRRIEASLANQEANIGKEEALLSSIDPALMEASNQVLKLLRGEESSAVAPQRQQRQRQRQALLNSLREQFGPGAESSSAGVQALTAFDSETSGLLSQAQQGSIGQLFGATASLLPSVSNSRGQAARGLAGTIGDRNQGIASAFLQGGAQVGQAAQQVTQSAGSRFVQDQLRGEQKQQLGTSLLNAGITAASGGFGGGGAKT